MEGVHTGSQAESLANLQADYSPRRRRVLIPLRFRSLIPSRGSESLSFLRLAFSSLASTSFRKALIATRLGSIPRVVMRTRSSTGIVTRTVNFSLEDRASLSFAQGSI